PVMAASTTGTAAITIRAFSIGRRLLSAGEPVAQEEGAVLLAQRPQCQAGWRHERRAGEDPFGVAGHEERRQRQAPLGEDAGGGATAPTRRRWPAPPGRSAPPARCRRRRGRCRPATVGRRTPGGRPGRRGPRTGPPPPSPRPPRRSC